jgi:hypothetical protein
LRRRVVGMSRQTFLRATIEDSIAKMSVPNPPGLLVQ